MKFRLAGLSGPAALIAALFCVSAANAAMPRSTVSGIDAYVAVKKAPRTDKVAYSSHQVRRRLRSHGYYDIDVSYRSNRPHRAYACRHGDRYRLQVDRLGNVIGSRFAGKCRRVGAVERIEIEPRRSGYGSRYLHIEGPYHSLSIRLR